MALSMIKSLKDTAEFTKALIEYLSLKNKVLFDSSTPWNSGTKTIKDISKYNLIQFDLELGGVSGVAIRRSDTVFTGTANANYPSWMGVTAFLISLNGDSCTLDWGWVDITGGGAPSVSYGIKRIVGIEPIISDALKNLGGGYGVTWLGGGLHAVIKAMLDGYRQFCKKRKDYSFCKAKQEVDEDCGKFWHYILQCRQIQRIAFSNIFRRSSYQDFYSCNDINKQCTNTFCRDVQQFRNLCEYKQNNHFGIQTTNWLHSRINSLWQIAPRGCCYA